MRNSGFENEGQCDLKIQTHVTQADLERIQHIKSLIGARSVSMAVRLILRAVDVDEIVERTRAGNNLSGEQEVRYVVRKKQKQKQNKK